MKPEEGAQGDFGEVFGIARSVNGSEITEAEIAQYREAYVNGEIELCEGSECRALPSSKELEEIWSKMLQEIKLQHSVHRWELNDAKCELRDEWICEAVFYRGEVRVVLPLYEEALTLISEEHEENSEQSRWHKITDIAEIKPNVQRLTIQSQYWQDGEKKNISVEVILDNGKPQYQ